MPAAIIQSELLAKVPGLAHGFTTRLTSPGENAALEANVSTGKQVHRDQFLWPSHYERRTHDADGVGTLTPGFSVGVYSADCTPVLLALSAKERILGVMAVHAGWRGTALKIVEQAVPTLFEKCGAPAKAKLFAAIGPCIGYENFEVSFDVIQAFPDSLKNGLARPFRVEGGEQKYQFDLPGENARQLKASTSRLGLGLELDSLALCTVADPQSFPSFRRDRESAGRILSYIAFRTDHA